MQRLVMCGKEERKGRAWSGFWGDEQITGIDVLPVIDRRLRADFKKRRFARKASLTQFFARMACTLSKIKSTLTIGRAFILNLPKFRGD